MLVKMMKICAVLALAAGLGLMPLAAQAEELVNGETVLVEVTEAGGFAVASIVVPEETASLTVDLAVAEGALGLGLNPLVAPDGADPGAWEQSQEPAEGQLALTVESPAAGTWYVLVYGLEPGAGSLTATYAALDVANPDNNQWTQGNLAAGQSLVYSIEIPEGTNFLKANLHTSLGSATLYTKNGSVPTEADNDCAAFSANGNAQCLHHWPAGGVWYALVTASEDSLVSVQMHYTENQQEESDPDLEGDGPPVTPPGKDKDKTKPEKDKTPPGQAKKQ